MSRRFAAILFATTVAISPVAAAQQGLASHTLLGKVTDSRGRALAGVTVELTNPAANDSMRTVETDRDGKYRLERVLPGVYVLTLRLAGFGPAIRDIEIGGGNEDFEFDVQLKELPDVQLKALPPGAAPPAAATQLPTRRVVCGMTVISPPASPDPLIVAPKPAPPGAQQVKPTIRAIQPTLCWESSSGAPPVPPNR